MSSDTPRNSNVRRPSIWLNNDPENKDAESFDDLAEAYPLMYRLFSRKSYVIMDIGGFIAPSYRDQSIPDEIPIIPITASDVIKAIDWEHWPKAATPYIATSLSLTYVLFGANQRHKNGEKDVTIALIRTRDFLKGRAFVALNALPKLLKRDLELRRITNAVQTVLVKGRIPRESISHLISFKDLVKYLPKYFLGDGKDDLDLGSLEQEEFKLLAANKIFYNRFNMGTQHKGSEISPRITQGSKMALTIITSRLSSKVPDSLDDFMQKSGAIDIAIDFAHFPSPGNDRDMATENYGKLRSETSIQKMKTIITEGIRSEFVERAFEGLSLDTATTSCDSEHEEEDDEKVELENEEEKEEEE